MTSSEVSRRSGSHPTLTRPNQSSTLRAFLSLYHISLCGTLLGFNKQRPPI